MYNHYSSFLLLSAAIIPTNAGLAWGIPNGVTMPIAKRYSAQDLIFNLRKARAPQYIDTVGCKDFLVAPIFNRDVSSGFDNNLDFSQFDGSTDIVAQQLAGVDSKQYHPNCHTGSYSSKKSIIGRDNQSPDFGTLDFLNNPNPFPIGETSTDPWADLKAPNIVTNLEVDTSRTVATGAPDTSLPGQNLVASAQTGAYDVPAPFQDTLVVPGGQDIKTPSPGTDFTNIPYNTAYDTILPNQGTDISNPTPDNPSFEQQLANVPYVPSPSSPFFAPSYSHNPACNLR